MSVGNEKILVRNTESDEREILGFLLRFGESVVVYEDRHGEPRYVPEDCASLVREAGLTDDERREWKLASS